MRRRRWSRPVAHLVGGEFTETHPDRILLQSINPPHRHHRCLRGSQQMPCNRAGDSFREQHQSIADLDGGAPHAQGGSFVSEDG